MGFMGRRKVKKELKQLDLPATRHQRRRSKKQVRKALKKSPMPTSRRQLRKWAEREEREFHEEVTVPVAENIARSPRKTKSGKRKDRVSLRKFEKSVMKSDRISQKEWLMEHSLEPIADALREVRETGRPVERTVEEIWPEGWMPPIRPKKKRGRR